MPEQSRREFLKTAIKAAGVAGAAMMGASCDNDNGSPREKMEVELPEALENFRDLSSGVLVVVANEDEERR